MGTLYLVATPIGNLEDISLRALRILRQVDWVAAEDTRHSARLLRHFDIEQRTLSLHEHNERDRAGHLCKLLDQGQDIALISDAGTPLLSDPGYVLVQAVLEAGHEVIPIPGASALLAALMAAGLPTDRFVFAGFPPRKQQARRAFLQEYRDRMETLVLYESPRRLPALLADVQTIMGVDRPVVVARELTKRFESFWRGPAAAAVRHFTQPPPGEIVVLIGGAAQPPRPELDAALEVVTALQAGGMPLSQAVRMVASLAKVSRRALYDAALQHQNHPDTRS